MDPEFEIELQLESGPPRRRRSRRRAHVPITERPPDDAQNVDAASTGAPASSRPRMAMGAAVVVSAVAVFVAGWVFGRASVDDGTDAVHVSFESGNRRDEPLVPSDSSELADLGGSPGTEPGPLPMEAPLQRRTTELQPRLLGAPSGIELVALSTEGDFVEIELDAGSLAVSDLPGLGTPDPPADDADSYIVPLVDETLLAVGGRGWYRVTLGGEPTGAPLVLDRAVAAYPSGDPMSMWFVRTSLRDGGATELAVQLVDSAGQGVRPLYQLPVPLRMRPDGRGDLLAASPLEFVVVPAGWPNVKLVGADGLRTVTRGEVAAVGPNHLIVLTCDETGACRSSLVDRDSGSATPLDVDGLGRESSAWFWIDGPGPTIAPDGTAAILGLADEGGEEFAEPAIVDLQSGRSRPIELAGAGASSPVVWSDDSRFLVILDGDRLTFFDRVSGDLREVDAEIPPLATIARRSAGDGSAPDALAVDDF